MSGHRRCLFCFCTVMRVNAFALQDSRLAGVAVRRIAPHPSLPWIFEADWQAQQQQQQQPTARQSLKGHDPLSSCYWPAALPLAQALARSLIPVSGAVVLELGCGTGLCSLCCAQAGAGEVIASDVDPLALLFTAAAAEEQQLTSVRTLRFDVTGESPLPFADVLILSDLFVTPALARAHAARVAEAVRRGYAHILVVDPGRSSRAAFLDELMRCKVEHSGFRHIDDAMSLAVAQADQLILLDTEEGAPVDFEI